MRISGQPRRHSQVTRALREAALAVAMIAAVLASVTQAGRTYVYCQAMQTMMSHACCPGHVAPRDADQQSWIAPDCCQGRHVSSLDPYAPANRDAQPLGFPVILALPARITVAAITRMPEARFDAPTMRAGPPKLRVHALVMVFNV